ncbi:hypothetical protein SUGI_0519180 [Cryptomeria japonica]|nr:hypothetical protein SUGI_0519180 [Cryptomeria japonica]
MGDPVSSGMTGYAIQLLGNQILCHIHVAIRCNKELDELKLLLLKIKTNECGIAGVSKGFQYIDRQITILCPPTFNSWLHELNYPMDEAFGLAQHCTVPSHSHLFFRYKMSRKIRQLTANVGKNLASKPLVALLQQQANGQVLQQINERVNSLNLPTPSTSGDLFPSTSNNKKCIEEALIVGHDSVSNTLVELIHSHCRKKMSRVGLVGKGGAGKTLLLKRVFNSNQMMFGKQVQVQPRCYRTCVCLSFHTTIPTSSLPLQEITSVLSKLGVPPSSIVQMQDLSEDDCWSLFSFHAFPQSEGILPISIDQEIARRVCKECGGFH